MKNIPIELQQSILTHASRLPEGEARRKFIQSVTLRTSELLKMNCWAMGYGAVGILLGEVIDQLLEITIPEKKILFKTIGPLVIKPTFDWGDKIFGAVGLWKGFRKDRQRNQQIATSRMALKEHEPILRKIIREELMLHFPQSGQTVSP